MFSQVLKAAPPAKAPSDEVPLTAYKQTCDGCRWRVDGIKCDAFPDGIPAAILLRVFDHHYSYDQGGVSDEGITYSPDQ